MRWIDFEFSFAHSKPRFYLSNSQKYFQSPWDFFDKPEKGSLNAKCKLCTVKPAIIKRTNWNTSGMRKHLQRIHNLNPIKKVPKSFPTSAEKSLKKRNSLGKLRANGSWVWTYFSIIDEQSALCSICGKFLARSATTGLIKHLQRVHSIAQKEELPEEKTCDDSDSSQENSVDIFDDLPQGMKGSSENHSTRQGFSPSVTLRLKFVHELQYICG